MRVAVQVHAAQRRQIDQGRLDAEALVEHVPGLADPVRGNAPAGDEQGARPNQRSETRTADVDPGGGLTADQAMDVDAVRCRRLREQRLQVDPGVGARLAGTADRDDDRPRPERARAVRRLGGERTRRGAGPAPPPRCRRFRVRAEK